MLLMQRLLIPSTMHMIGIIGTTWTSEADELAGPSSYKYNTSKSFCYESPITSDATVAFFESKSAFA